MREKWMMEGSRKNAREMNNNKCARSEQYKRARNEQYKP